jgi:hypothetical protein
MTSENDDVIRNAARAALVARKALDDAWSNSDRISFSRGATREDVALLKELIISRTEILSAFEVLCRVDVQEATSVLLSRYVGDAVDPDTKYGGFEFELSTMLDNLNEIGDPEALQRLAAAIDDEKLRDPRVVRAFCDALDIDSDAFAVWLKGS